MGRTSRRETLPSWEVLAFLIALLVAILPAGAQAPLDSASGPALISADEIIYDESLGLITAKGNVEISHEGRVVRADTVTYNLRSEVVTASGNVSLTETTGEVAFAEYVELTSDLREGFVQAIRVLMTDDARLAAERGLRTAGNRTVFNRAVFSPCELCAEDPTRPPLWQLRAAKVVHDKEAQVIRYSHARLEFFGVPVLYTPYLQHPDPTVERKSGFLAPGFGSSEFLGTTFEIPYYWAIAPNEDLTVTPKYTTDQGVLLQGEFRRLFRHGLLEVAGSGTQADRLDRGRTVEDDVFRGHIDAAARFDIDETWRAGLDIQRTTDDTFLRSYDISTESRLTSDVFLEGFRGRNHLKTSAFAYQSLRADEPDEQLPIVAPFVELNYQSEPGIAGGLYTLDSSLLALTREEGRDVRRLAFLGGWELPFTGPVGDVYSLRATLQADGYHTSNFLPGGGADPLAGDDSDFAGRLFPQVALQWRYPWFSDAFGAQQIVEPIAQVVIGPNGGNPDDIPNEDSIDFEFDDTNLFEMSRFTGVDLVDPGQRLDYGLRYSLTMPSGLYSEAFIGQSYRLEENDLFPETSGLADNFSDFVGRLYLQPFDELSLSYRFRLDKDDLTHRRAEVGAVAGIPELRVAANYLFLEGVPFDERFGDREELTWRVSSRFTENWSAFVGGREDLIAGDTLQNSFGIGYQDECFLVLATFTRKQFSDREIEPEDTFFIRIGFKYLGEFGG